MPGGFDLVVAHGRSWLGSPPVGDALLRPAQRALRPGGILFVSCNSLPAWLQALAFQHSVRSAQAVLPDGRPSLDAAIALVRTLPPPLDASADPPLSAAPSPQC